MTPGRGQFHGSRATKEGWRVRLDPSSRSNKQDEGVVRFKCPCSEHQKVINLNCTASPNESLYDRVGNLCSRTRREQSAGGVGPTTVLDHSQVSSAGLDTRGAHHGHCSSKSELCLDRLLVVLTSRHPPARLLSSRHRVIETASNLIVDHVGPGRRCPKLQCW